MKRLGILFVLAALFAFGCTGLSSEFGEGSSGAELKSAPSSFPTAPPTYEADGSYVTKESYVTIKVPEDTLQTKFENLQDTLKSNGAQISDIRYNEYGNRKEYTITVKVPPTKFDTINTLLKEVGELKDLSVNLEEVTQQYVDLDTRIKNREVELNRLYELYNQSEKVEDLLSVEREITRVETDLELLKQQKQYLVSRIEQSTITITLYEDKPATQQLTLSLEGLGALFFGAVALAITLLVGASGFLLPLIIVILVLWFIYKKLQGSGGGGGGDKVKPRKPEHGQIPPPQ